MLRYLFFFLICGVFNPALADFALKDSRAENQLGYDGNLFNLEEQNPIIAINPEVDYANIISSASQSPSSDSLIPISDSMLDGTLSTSASEPLGLFSSNEFPLSVPGQPLGVVSNDLLSDCSAENEPNNQLFSKKGRKRETGTGICSPHPDDDDEQFDFSGLGNLLNDVLDNPALNEAFAAAKKRSDNPCEDSDDCLCCPSESFYSGIFLAVRGCTPFRGILDCLTMHSGDLYCCAVATLESTGALSGLNCIKVEFSL